MIPNPSLLDNHQLELADELAKQGYVVHGRLEFVIRPHSHTNATTNCSLPIVIYRTLYKKPNHFEARSKAGLPPTVAKIRRAADWLESWMMRWGFWIRVSGALGLLLGILHSIVLRAW